MQWFDNLISVARVCGPIAGWAPLSWRNPSDTSMPLIRNAASSLDPGSSELALPCCCAVSNSLSSVRHGSAYKHGSGLCDMRTPYGVSHEASAECMDNDSAGVEHSAHANSTLIWWNPCYCRACHLHVNPHQVCTHAAFQLACAAHTWSSPSSLANPSSALWRARVTAVQSASCLEQQQHLATGGLRHACHAVTGLHA